MQYFRNRDLFKVVFNRQLADLALAFLIFVFLLVIIRHDFVVIVWLVEIDVYLMYNKLKAYNSRLIAGSRLVLVLQEEVLALREVRPPGISTTLPVGPTRRPGPLYPAREA